MVLIGFREPYVPGEWGVCQTDKSFHNHRVISSGNVVIGNHIEIASFFFPFLAFPQNFFSSQADCRYAATVEPIKTDGPQVSLCKHKLLHSHSSAAEPCVMDADIITILSRSWEVYAVREGVMLDPQSRPWRDKQSDILHPVTLY